MIASTTIDGDGGVDRGDVAQVRAPLDARDALQRREPGGAGLGLVVYEQLSVHNLTLTEKATGRTAAAASDVFGFTEWSGPA